MIENVVYNMDCNEYMAQLADNHYDLAIVDPPYGIYSEKKKTGFARNYETQAEANKWDHRPTASYFKALFRVSKHQIIWGLQYFAADLPDFSQIIVWDKGNGDSYFADGEAAFCSIPGTLRIFRHKWAGYFKASERGEPAIQTGQKPIVLYRWLLERYAKPGYKIFDSHVGSGSIRFACRELGLDFHGCENDPVNWKQQEDRFEAYKDQQLFGLSEIQEVIE